LALGMAFLLSLGSGLKDDVSLVGAVMMDESMASLGAPVFEFPGPPAGLPGYKISHDWENAVDIFSPLVFRDAYYTANYAKKGGMVAAKKSWNESLRNKKYPNCDQGVSSFSANQYLRANVGKTGFLEKGTPACIDIVKHFLTVGVYNGLRTYSAAAERLARKHVVQQQKHVNQLQGDMVGVSLRLKKGAGNENQWNLEAVHGDFGPKVIDSQPQYTYTWWMKLNDHNGPLKDASVLSYGDTKDAASPGVYQVAGQKTLRIQVAMHSNNAFSCQPEAELQDKKWEFVGLVVQRGKVNVYYNGKLAKSCSSDGGAPIVMKDQSLHFPAPASWGPRANADVRDAWYYPNVKLSTEVMNAQMTLQHLQNVEEMVMREGKLRMEQDKNTRLMESSTLDMAPVFVDRSKPTPLHT